jgi:hypothetical protein
MSSEHQARNGHNRPGLYLVAGRPYYLMMEATADGISTKSINSYLIEQLARTSHLAEQTEISSRQNQLFDVRRKTTKIGRRALNKKFSG